MGAMGGKGGMVIRSPKGKGMGRGMKGAGRGMKGSGRRAQDRWEHDRYDIDPGMDEEDAWFRARGGGKGRKGWGKGKGDEYPDMGSRPATPRNSGGGSADTTALTA